MDICNSIQMSDQRKASVWLKAQQWWNAAPSRTWTSDSRVAWLSSQSRYVWSLVLDHIGSRNWKPCWDFFFFSIWFKPPRSGKYTVTLKLVECGSKLSGLCGSRIMSTVWKHGWLCYCAQMAISSWKISVLIFVTLVLVTCVPAKWHTSEYDEPKNQ